MSMGCKLRIVLGPMFHDAIFALAIKEATMFSLSLVFLHRILHPLLLLSHHAIALSSQLSALRPGKQHHP